MSDRWKTEIETYEMIYIYVCMYCQTLPLHSFKFVNSNLSSEQNLHLRVLHMVRYKQSNSYREKDWNRVLLRYISANIKYTYTRSFWRHNKCFALFKLLQNILNYPPTIWALDFMYGSIEEVTLVSPTYILISFPDQLSEEAKLEICHIYIIMSLSLVQIMGNFCLEPALS